MEYSYDAFISYSRSASTPLAEVLQRDLERFAKPWHALRSRRVFRDDSSLSASPALWGNIVEAMQASRWLILLATPESATSEYVERELSWWLQEKGPDSILVVHSKGTIGWERSSNTFHPASSAIPAILRNAFLEEPRWVDLTWFDEPSGQQDPRLVERVADLASAISGVDRDTLHGENLRQQRKALRLARVGAAVLVVLLVASVVGFGVAVTQRSEAQDQARISTARLLSSESRSLLSTDIQLSRLLAVQGYELHEDQQTKSALLAAISTTPQVIDSLDAGATVEHISVSGDGNVIVFVDVDNSLNTWRPDNGERRHLGQIIGSVTDVSVSGDGEVIAVATEDNAQLWVAGAEVAFPSDALREVAVSPTGQTVAFTTAKVEPSVAFYGDNQIGLVSVTSGQVVDLGHRVTSSPFAAQLALPNDDQIVAWIDIEEYGTVETRKLPDLTPIRTISGSSGTPRDFVGTLSPRGDYLLQVDRSSAIGESELPLFRTDRDSDAQAPDLAGFAPAFDIQALAVSPLATHIAVAADGSIYVSELSAPYEVPEPVKLSGSSEIKRGGLAFDDSGVLVSAAGSTITRWQPERENPLVTRWPAEIADPSQASGPPTISVNENGTQIVVTEVGGALNGPGWGTITWHDRETMEQESRQASFLAWTDESTALVLEDSAVVEYDSLFANEISRRQIPDDALDGLDHSYLRSIFDPLTNELIIGGKEGIVHVTEAGKVTHSYSEYGVLDLSSGGKWAIVRSSLGVGGESQKLLDLATGEVAQLHDDTTGEAADLPSGRVWVNRETGEIRLGGADATPLAERFAVNLGEARTKDLSVTSGSDGTLLITDVDNGTPIGEFSIGADRFAKIGVDFSTNGESLIAAVPHYDTDFLAHIDLDPSVWRDVACSSVAQPLTLEQWRKYSTLPPPDRLACQGGD